MRHRCNCRHSFKNSPAMNLPHIMHRGSVIVVRWENSRLQWPSCSHFHLCVWRADLVLVHCDAGNKNKPSHWLQGFLWVYSYTALSYYVAFGPICTFAKSIRFRKDGTTGPFLPSPSITLVRGAILPPAFAHITVLGLKVDNLVLSEFQTIIFKQFPHEPNTWTAPCPYGLWGRTPDESDNPITHWDLNRTRKWWDWTCVVSLVNLKLPLLNI